MVALGPEYAPGCDVLPEKNPVDLDARFTGGSLRVYDDIAPADFLGFGAPDVETITGLEKRTHRMAGDFEYFHVAAQSRCIGFAQR